MSTLLLYISGHGYGHAVRTAELIRVAKTIDPSLDVLVRTCAPRAIVAPVEMDGLRVEHSDLDTSVVEDSTALQIDVPATVVGVERLYERRTTVIQGELRRVESENIGLILSDIPYLAGYIAESVGVECWGVANFTWDWIYEPYFDARRSPAKLRDFVSNGYRKMARLLQLPFGHHVSAVARVDRMPLVARPSSLGVQEARSRIGLPPDGRPVIVVGMRGFHSPESLCSVATLSPNLLFVTLGDSPVETIENVRTVSLGEDVGFADVLRASDIVVSKLGYGILADSIVNKTAILWPKRSDFREDVLLEEAAQKYVRSRHIPTSDFQSGHWRSHLKSLLDTSEPTETLQADGAEVCARYVLSELSGR